MEGRRARRSLPLTVPVDSSEVGDGGAVGSGGRPAAKGGADGSSATVAAPAGSGSGTATSQEARLSSNGDRGGDRGGGGGAGSSDGNDGTSNILASAAVIGFESRNHEVARGGNGGVNGGAATGGVEAGSSKEEAPTGAAGGTGSTTESLVSLKRGGESDGLDVSTNGNDSGSESKVDEDGEEVVDCSICMCAVTGEEDAASLDKCTHSFHFACIVKWGETTNQCPMCKVRYCLVDLTCCVQTAAATMSHVRGMVCSRLDVLHTG